MIPWIIKELIDRFILVELEIKLKVKEKIFLQFPFIFLQSSYFIIQNE